MLTLCSILRLKDQKELEQSDPQLWDEHCQFFCLEPLNHDPAFNITTLRGFTYSRTVDNNAAISQGLHLPQTYAAFFMLRKWRHSLVGGGFLADRMGVGKTLETLIFIICCRLISLAWKDVEISWTQENTCWRRQISGGKAQMIVIL
jgi:SNF2 family DNA or RNA helicase